MQALPNNRSSSLEKTPLLVYVHFPYCLEKCPYCDFVSFKTERPSIPHAGYADAVLSELGRRVEALSSQQNVFARLSVFFGGGTPSLWEPKELGRVLSGIEALLPGGSEIEVTAECNPTSLDRDRAKALLDVGVNRLSIGVQGLDQERLRFLGRMHDPAGALSAIEGARAAGVARVSGDLIYGVAGQSPEAAASDAERLVDAGLNHVSAYNLTIESGTRFGELARRGRLPLAEDQTMVDGFFAIDEALQGRGLEHYEISNYGRPGQASRHNLGYWRGAFYMGLGCGAFGTLPHGDRVVRYRNSPVPAKYMASASHGALYEDGALVDSVEQLSTDDRLKERIMLGLRIAEGFDLEQAADEVGAVAWTDERLRAVDRMEKRGRLLREGSRLRVPREAWIFADGTAAELFLNAASAQACARRLAQHRQRLDPRPVGLRGRAWPGAHRQSVGPSRGEPGGPLLRERRSRGARLSREARLTADPPDACRRSDGEAPRDRCAPQALRRTCLALARSDRALRRLASRDARPFARRNEHQDEPHHGLAPWVAHGLAWWPDAACGAPAHPRSRLPWELPCAPFVACCSRPLWRAPCALGLRWRLAQSGCAWVLHTPLACPSAHHG